ncbi:MAG TPA: amidohydrolase family protein [Acidimicrobiales bacterium]|nr:amidohydrolase family protein [Acidimicrobiales bacterium]
MMPTDIGVVDLMIGFPSQEPRRHYEYLRAMAKDAESQEMEFPAEYMFKDVPDRLDDEVNPVDVTLAAMDRHGIALGMVGLGNEATLEALMRFPDRFVASFEVDPNEISRTVRRIRHAHAEHGIVAVTTFPAGCSPQVPVSDRRYYPIYQTCIDLDLPVVVNAGIAGPRVPSECQHVMHFDQVCYDFPELRIVMRHGAEPWEDLAVKLMLKWPGLFYMTSGFAPKYYPSAIVDYANTRGADKIMYAGYYPMGLDLARIFAELPNVPFRDHVWPKFLRENALRVFKLEDRS